MTSVIISISLILGSVSCISGFSYLTDVISDNIRTAISKNIEEEIGSKNLGNTDVVKPFMDNIALTAYHENETFVRMKILENCSSEDQLPACKNLLAEMVLTLSL